MKDTLRFDDRKYTVETLELEGKTLVYRAFENIPYVEHPVDEKMQRLSIFAPEAYFQGGSIGAYDRDNAPIFLPNSVGGYMPGPQTRPGKNFMGKANASFLALLHGYVVVSPGVRGREMQDENGHYIGTAPAVICDLKAAVRYLRHNADRIPGDVEKIISNGTSAGGAISGLLGASGNHPDYVPYLEAMGAADERDDIFAASCYCPITNLEHADMAYEWEFEGIRDYHRMHMERPAPGGDQPKMTPIDGQMGDEQMEWSTALARQFPAYVNGLDLKDEAGQPLVLDEEGNGSFKTYVEKLVMASAQKELERESAKGNVESAEESPKRKEHSGDFGYLKAHPMEQRWLTIEDGKVTGIDFNGYVKFRTRMKQTPAFDSTELGTPENELFGTPERKCRHFTRFGLENSKGNGELADEGQIRRMNPMNYIGDAAATKAKHFRIRHGSMDRDTSLAIPAMLALKLKNQGIDTDIAYPWGLPHAGDYDLDELFAWIDDNVSVQMTTRPKP